MSWVIFYIWWVSKTWLYWNASKNSVYLRKLESLKVEIIYEHTYESGAALS